MSKTPFGKRVNTEPFRERTELRRTISQLVVGNDGREFVSEKKS